MLVQGSGKGRDGRWEAGWAGLSSGKPQVTHVMHKSSARSGPPLPAPIPPNLGLPVEGHLWSLCLFCKTK